MWGVLQGSVGSPIINSLLPNSLLPIFSSSPGFLGAARARACLPGVGTHTPHGHRSSSRAEATQPGVAMGGAMPPESRGRMTGTVAREAKVPTAARRREGLHFT